MRPIKFRAWDYFHKKMIYNPHILCIQGVLYSPVLDDENLPLMQFTGLTDKNGKEIYEGDILRDQKGQPGQVLWHQNSWLVEWTTRSNSEGHRDVERMVDNCLSYGEVIGNRFENAELLQ